MQHRQGPTARSWTPVPPGRGGKGVGGGPRLGEMREKYDCAVGSLPNETTFHGNIFQRGHENSQVMCDAHCVIPANETHER